MLCPNCQTENDDSANFCSNCRTPLNKTEEKTAEPAAPAEAETKTEAPATETPVAAAPAAAPVAPKAAGSTPNFFAVMLAGVLKPMTTFKENLEKFADFKNSAILSLIIVAIATVLQTTTTVVGIVRTEECVENCRSSYSYFSSSSDEKKEPKMETKWDWDNLKEVKFDWFKNVGQTFLMNAVVVLALSGAYFGLSKAFKSQTANFGRMMSVVAIGMIPAVVMGFLAPIIGAVSTLFSGILYLAALGYSISIIFVGLNNESGVEGDKRVYLNIAALACMVVVYYLIVRFMYGEIGGKMFKALIEGFGGGGSGFTSFTGGSSSFDLDDLLDF